MDETPRLALPYLYPGQAGKELTHNDALLRLDLVVHPVVLGLADTAPAEPVRGETWIVGASPAGAWSAYAGQLAQWSDGGWHFAAPVTGMVVKQAGDDRRWLYRNGGWEVAQPFLPPSGGAVVDQEARLAVAALAQILQRWGLAAG